MRKDEEDKDGIEQQSRSLERRFKLSEHGTRTKAEIIAGITTFMTMAYILVVNPIILSRNRDGQRGDSYCNSVICRNRYHSDGFLSQSAFALAPGMGLNAFFAFTVVIEMGYSWQFALTAVLIEGIIFILLTF